MYTILDRLRFENQQTDNLKQQEKLRQEKYQNESKPNDMKHITFCMTLIVFSLSISFLKSYM